MTVYMNFQSWVDYNPLLDKFDISPTGFLSALGAGEILDFIEKSSALFVQGDNNSMVLSADYRKATFYKWVDKVHVPYIKKVRKKKGKNEVLKNLSLLLSKDVDKSRIKMIEKIVQFSPKFDISLLSDRRKFGTRSIQKMYYYIFLYSDNRLGNYKTFRHISRVYNRHVKKADKVW